MAMVPTALSKMINLGTGSLVILCRGNRVIHLTA